MRSPWDPGQSSRERGSLRENNLGNYDATGEKLWQAISDVYHARLHGFDANRQPRPGEAIDAERYRAWKSRVLNHYQHGSYGKTDEQRPLVEGDLAEHVWLYWYERSLAAAEGR